MELTQLLKLMFQLTMQLIQVVIMSLFMIYLEKKLLL